RQLQDWKFRRQHPVDRYVIDFYCPEVRRAIELDGGGHNFAAKESLDQARTRFLASKDIQILRFGIMRSAKSWTASWKQFGQRWSNEENPHLNHLPLRKGRGKRRLSQTSRKN